MRTMYHLKDNMLAHLERDKAKILEARYPDDMLHEIVDLWMPGYHFELTELLASKPSLGDGPSDYGLVKQEPTVWDILTAAVYEDLMQAASDWLSDAIVEAGAQ